MRFVVNGSFTMRGSDHRYWRIDDMDLLGVRFDGDGNHDTASKIQVDPRTEFHMAVSQRVATFEQVKLIAEALNYMAEHGPPPRQEPPPEPEPRGDAPTTFYDLPAGLRTWHTEPSA